MQITDHHDFVCPLSCCIVTSRSQSIGADDSVSLTSVRQFVAISSVSLQKGDRAREALNVRIDTTSNLSSLPLPIVVCQSSGII